MSKSKKPTVIPASEPGSSSAVLPRDPGSSPGRHSIFKGFLGLLMISITLLLIFSSEMNVQSQTHSRDSLVVSFISIGTGIDYKAKEKLDFFVTNFESKHQVKLEVKIKHWGREGETDYTYYLAKLSRKQCREFVEEVEILFSKNNLVKISQRLVD